MKKIIASLRRIKPNNPISRSAIEKAIKHLQADDKEKLAGGMVQLVLDQHKMGTVRLKPSEILALQKALEFIKKKERENDAK